MKEYAFDVELAAVVRVEAENEDEACDAMRDILDALDPSPDFVAGYNSRARVRVTECSLKKREYLFV